MPGTTPIVGDLLQIRTVCYTDTQISMNVLHYEVAATAGTPQTLAVIATLFETRVFTAYATLMPSTARWRGCDVQNVMPVPTLKFPSVIHDQVGISGDTLTPTQSSLLIHTNANFAGRKYLGRVYPGLLSTAWCTVDGHLDVAGLAKLDILKNLLGPSLVLVGDTGQTSLALTIRHPNSLGPVITPTWDRVLSMVSSPKIATQRRRGQFGAANVPRF